MPERYAIDTNVLLRIANGTDVAQRLVESALDRLLAQGVELCFTPQSLGEFWSVSTRPIERNGFGLSIEEADARLRQIERTMSVLEEDSRVYLAWRRLLVAHQVLGVQVHDAHLAATLQVHHVTRLLTFNGADFKRYPHIDAVHPQNV